MLGWGIAVFIGLWIILSDMKPITKARLMGNPMLVHIIVLGSGFYLHGGSAEGAMAAVISGVFSGLYVKINRRLYGYIKNNVWYPGTLRPNDPRAA